MVRPRSGGPTGRWRPFGSPEPFLDAHGWRLAGSIAEKTWVDINGVRQGMVIRGKRSTNPILLWVPGWVHGGPGMPDYPLTRRYPPGIEDSVTIVWWDQRGAGLSCSPSIPADSMTVERFVDDTVAVTDYLRQRFDQDRIYLLGHSWGSYIALLAAARAPERYALYLGRAQMVHQMESEAIAHDYMLATYREPGDARMVRRLEVAFVTMSGGTPARYLKVRDTAMHRVGIGTTHDMTSVITGIFPSLPVVPGLHRAGADRPVAGRGVLAGLRAVGPPSPRRHAVHRALAAHPGALPGGHLRLHVRHLPGRARRPPPRVGQGVSLFANSAHSPLLEESDIAQAIIEHDVLRGRNRQAASIAAQATGQDGEE